MGTLQEGQPFIDRPPSSEHPAAAYWRPVENEITWHDVGALARELHHLGVSRTAILAAANDDGVPVADPDHMFEQLARLERSVSAELHERHPAVYPNRHRPFTAQAVKLDMDVGARTKQVK